MKNINKHHMSSFEIYKKVLTYISEFWGRFVISIVAMLIAAATEPAFARIIKRLIDNGFINQDRNTIIYTPIIIMLIFLIRAIASFLNDYMTSWLSGSVVEKMRRITFSKILHLPVEYYDENHSGRMISRILFDVTQITDAGFNIITVIFKDGVTVLALIGLLLYTDWHLTLFCFVTLPFVLILIKRLSGKLRTLTTKNQQQYGEMTQIISESIHGQKIVKLYRGVEYEMERFDHKIKAIKNNNVKQAATGSLNSGISQFLVACALSLILYFAAAKAKSHHFSAGDFVSFLTAMIMIFAPMKRITGVTQSLQKGLTAANSVFNFLDNPEELNQGKIKLQGLKQKISFKNVTLKYKTSEKKALDNVSFQINVGETVALVGSSGSGKTTIAHLLPRFYNVSQGEILIDDINLCDIELSSLRENIALVSQDVFLFNDTIFKNISYGISIDKVNNEKVIEAAKLSNALEFINQLPDGFDTIIGENGTKLSGGQKQRIAIARAILKDAPILILDEATSALDNISEKLVQEALETLMKKKTTLVIAHRLSTVINANKLIVMNKGKVEEIGTHTELISKRGIYYNLYNIQGTFIEN